MFFTYDKPAVLMPCMWVIGNSKPITSGLLSYGVLFIKTGSFAPWKWFMGMSCYCVCAGVWVLLWQGTDMTWLI